MRAFAVLRLALAPLCLTLAPLCLTLAPGMAHAVPRFALRDDAPVLRTIGFQHLPTHRVGLCTDEYRRHA